MAAPQETNSKPDIHEQLPPRAPAPEYHPAFADTDAEIVVSSSEGTLYRVHAYTLCTTSGLFQNSALPPRRHPAATPLNLSLSMSPMPSSSHYCALCNWDAPGPIAFLRPRTHVPQIPHRQPAPCLASSHTLSLNLFDPTNAEVLASMPATAALPLLRLHRSRRDGLRDLLDSPERFLAGNGQPFHCSACAITPLENRTWRALKHRVLRELDMCASGDALKEGMWSQGGMGGWAEAKACWAAVCVKVGCGAANYDRVATIKQIRTCLEGLPVAVEVEWIREDEDTK
ncbi:F-box domain-containing protein [Mycena venus]|uniref:F-box domain-containing protein n=1 Tax=Mycena venus TaxID=2733690 RepID=A0A8H6X5Z5_9AGAR|nr:F-box domain-containing protein [Mycena venus]